MISGASGVPAGVGAPDATSSAPLPALEWKFSQVFGERAIGEEVQEGMLWIAVALGGRVCIP